MIFHSIIKVIKEKSDRKVTFEIEILAEKSQNRF